MPCYPGRHDAGSAPRADPLHPDSKRKPLETRQKSFDVLKIPEMVEKAQFTTKLHFFALYQQKLTWQKGLQQFFTMKSRT
jgi:hypothetical protein